jgi:spore maturation protein CgeB
MSGGFYLVQEAPDHSDYYKIGHEIETWSRQEELIDKIVFYLKHPASAERIRQAGEKRAIVCHTWRHRFDRLFERIGLLPRSSTGSVVA